MIYEAEPFIIPTCTKLCTPQRPMFQLSKYTLKTYKDYDECYVFIFCGPFWYN